MPQAFMEGYRMTEELDKFAKRIEGFQTYGNFAVPEWHRTSATTIRERLEICSACPLFDLAEKVCNYQKPCAKCGGGRPAENKTQFAIRLAWQRKVCPMDKWPKAEA